jgi:simple sugar transport system permease protein
LLAALGGVLCEAAGTFAVAIEGMMLAGAFSGAVTAFVTHSASAGFLMSAFGGAALGLVVAIATIRFRADQMVSGLAINIFAVGVTSFLFRSLFGGHPPVIRLSPPEMISIPILSSIPVIGPVLFQQPLLTDLAFVLPWPIHFFLTATRPGLALRAVGENPSAAFSVGIDPFRVRFAAIIAGGLLAGVGGAALSLQELGTFTDGMTNGRGFIALAAIIVGRWMPFRVMLACLLFGSVSALALDIQGWGLPVSSYVIQMTPYLITLAVLCWIGRRAKMPDAIGKAFVRS